MNKTLQVPHMPETVKAMSKKIHKFSRFIRKPLIQKKARVSSLNLSFAEDSISTCDLHSNEEVDSFSIIEEEKSEVGSSPSKVYKRYFSIYIYIYFMTINSIFLYLLYAILYKSPFMALYINF